jgi:hypothetical protein
LFIFISFGGIGIARESGAELAMKIQYENRKARDRWTSTRVLVIDESKALTPICAYFECSR